MRFGNKTLALLALLCGSAVQANGDEANDDKGPLQIGEHFPIRLSSQESDSSINSSVTGKGSKTYTIHHPGASYIAVHFANIDLDPSCSMEISDANGEQRTVMRGRGRQDLGTFWARHIEGEIMEVTLKCNGNNKKADFVIDDYVAGYPKDHHTTEERKRNLRAQDPFAQDLSRDLSICDTDDKENAKCYQTSHQVEYGKAKAVARLIINGSGGCTGWLVGPNNVLLTNEHCITSNSDAQNTDYQFMYEGANCGSNSVSGVSTFDGLNLLKDNYAKDYALVQLSGNPVDTFG
jgi:lysyl endopeptidase